MSRVTERSTIIGVLRRIDLKVRLNQTLHHLSVATCLVLGALLLIEVAPLLVPVSAPRGSLIVTAGLAAFLAFLIWSQVGGWRLERAAGVADQRADLHDEIKSAYWFIRQDDSSPWVDLLVGRAAQTARRLDPRRLVPVTIPKRFGLALVLFGVLQVMALVPTDGPLLTFAAASDSTRFEQAREAYADEIRDLIDGEGDELLDEDALALFEAALEELEAADTSFDDLLRNLREAQDLLDEGNLEMAATRDALQELLQEFSGSDELADFADAMMNESLSDAAERLRNLSDRLGDLAPQDLSELGDRLQDASQVDEPVIDELLVALLEAADAISEGRLDDAEAALERVVAALEDIAEQQAHQEANNDASDAAEAMQEALALVQQPGGSPGQEGQMAQSQAASGERSPASSPSSEVTRSGDGSSRARAQSGPAGNATGDPSGNDLELGASTTLEAQLALEVIDGETPELGEEERELDPEDLFQEASRKQTSLVQYGDVRTPSQYSRGSALNAERIPWKYRSLVKKYFLAIRPDERK